MAVLCEVNGCVRNDVCALRFACRLGLRCSFDVARRELSKCKRVPEPVRDSLKRKVFTNRSEYSLLFVQLAGFALPSCVLLCFLRSTLPVSGFSVCRRGLFSTMESIYNLIPQHERKVEKPPMYRSKHKPTQKIDSTFNTKKVTTRRLQTQKPDPKKFLTRNSGVQRSKSAPNKTQRPRRVSKKPAVPRRNEKPIVGLQSSKDFVVGNAVENILAVPMRRQAPKVNYLKKKDYGRVPEYLQHVKKDIEEEKRVIEDYFSDQQSYSYQQQGELLPDRERQDVLRKLKAKWAHANERYQKITHNTILDTIGKVRRKEQCEKELEQLQKDIEKLSTKRPIMIVDSNPYY